MTKSKEVRRLPDEEFYRIVSWFGAAYIVLALVLIAFLEWLDRR